MDSNKKKLVPKAAAKVQIISKKSKISFTLINTRETSRMRIRTAWSRLHSSLPFFQL